MGKTTGAGGAIGRKRAWKVQWQRWEGPNQMADWFRSLDSLQMWVECMRECESVSEQVL